MEDEARHHIQKELDLLFSDGRVAEWARAARIALPEEARSWDRSGGYWLCVFKDEHANHRPTMFLHFSADEYLVSGLQFETETEADLAGWAWERMLHDFFGLASIDRDPGVSTPLFVRAEWFPPMRDEEASFPR